MYTIFTSSFTLRLPFKFELRFKELTCFLLIKISLSSNLLQDCPLMNCVNLSLKLTYNIIFWILVYDPLFIYFWMINFNVLIGPQDTLIAD